MTNPGKCSYSWTPDGPCTDPDQAPNYICTANNPTSCTNGCNINTSVVCLTSGCNNVSPSGGSNTPYPVGTAFSYEDFSNYMGPACQTIDCAATAGSYSCNSAGQSYDNMIHADFTTVPGNWLGLSCLDQAQSTFLSTYQASGAVESTNGNTISLVGGICDCLVEDSSIVYAADGTCSGIYPFTPPLNIPYRNSCDGIAISKFNASQPGTSGTVTNVVTGTDSTDSFITVSSTGQCSSSVPSSVPSSGDSLTSIILFSLLIAFVFVFIMQYRKFR